MASTKAWNSTAVTKFLDLSLKSMNGSQNLK